jgi:hypothetical protein
MITQKITVHPSNILSTAVALELSVVFTTKLLAMEWFNSENTTASGITLVLDPVD